MKVEDYTFAIFDNDIYDKDVWIDLHEVPALLFEANKKYHIFYQPDIIVGEDGLTYSLSWLKDFSHKVITGVN